MNGSPISYVGDEVSGVSDSGNDAVAQVMALLKQLEMGPPVPRPAPPQRPHPARAILGGLGDAILSMASVRAGGQPVPRGPYGQEQLLGEQQYQQRLDEANRNQLQNEAANRNLRNTVRMVSLNRSPRNVQFDSWVGKVNGEPHRMRQALDPRTGTAVGEPEDLGPVGYAPKELSPTEANTERDRQARAKEVALVKVDKLRSESIDFNAKMAAIRNQIGQGKAPGVPSRVPFMSGTPAVAGTQWDDVIQEDPTGEKPPPSKTLTPYIGITYRQAYNALKSKNEANVKEINRLWSIANPGGSSPPSTRQPAQSRTAVTATVPGYTAAEINAYRDTLDEDELDAFEGFTPDGKKIALDGAYGRSHKP